MKVGTADTGLVFINDAAYVVVRGFEIRNFITSSSAEMPVGIRVATAGHTHDIIIAENYIHDINNTDTTVNAQGHGIGVYGTSATAITHLSIIHNEVTRTMTGYSETIAINSNVQYFQVTDNYIHNTDNIGIDIIGFESGQAPVNNQARNGLVTRNIISHVTSTTNPSYGFQSGADGLYVDGGKVSV